MPADAFPRLDLLSVYPADVAVEANRRMDEVFATVPFTQTIVGPGQKAGRDVPYLYHSAGTKGGSGLGHPSHSAAPSPVLRQEWQRNEGYNGTVCLSTPRAASRTAFWSVTVYCMPAVADFIRTAMTATTSTARRR